MPDKMITYQFFFSGGLFTDQVNKLPEPFFFFPEGLSFEFGNNYLTVFFLLGAYF